MNEAVSCSFVFHSFMYTAGLHYVATNKAWEIPGLRWSDHNTVNIHDFLSPLPNIVPKSYGVETLPLSQIRQQCHCPNLCHIDDKSFIARYPEAVQEILSPMYTNHLPKMNNILMNETFRYSLPRNNSNDYVDYFPPIPVSGHVVTYHIICLISDT